MVAIIRAITYTVLVIASVLSPSFALAVDSDDSSTKNQAVVWGAKNWWRVLARANDAEASRYGQLISETTAYLSKRSPRACMRMIMPSVFGPLHKNEWPKFFIEQQMAIQQRIVTTAFTNPNAIPTEAEAGPILDQVLATLSIRHGAEAVKLLSRTDNDIPQEAGCIMWSRLYGEAASLPHAKGGVLIRWLNVP